jgi:threonine synthase
MNCAIYVPSEFEAPRKAEIEAMGGKVVVVRGDYEAAIRQVAEDSLARNWYNGNPGGPSRDLGVYSYTFIAREIAQSFGRQPDWVSVPVGNGTVLTGIWQGFRAIGMKPRMLGCSNNNAAVYGIACRQKVPVPVPDLKITEVNEPLSGNYLTDGQEAMDAILESNGSVADIPDEDLVLASSIVKEEEGLDILPASAGAIWGITQLESRNHTFVAVATGRGHPRRA